MPELSEPGVAPGGRREGGTVWGKISGAGWPEYFRRKDMKSLHIQGSGTL